MLTDGLQLFACPHGHIYILALQRRHESPRTCFVHLTDRFSKDQLPDVFLYDNTVLLVCITSCFAFVHLYMHRERQGGQ